MGNNNSIYSYQSINKKYIECPICFDVTKNFYLSKCKHSWCNSCNVKLTKYRCPLCRCSLLTIAQRRKILLDFLKMYYNIE